MKRMLAILLALVLCVSLSGCGKEERAPVTTLADELGYGYLSEYSELTVELNYVNSVSSADGKLYLSGDYYDEETYEGGMRLYSVDISGGAVERIPIPELQNDETQNEYIQCLRVCADGSGYWYVTETYIYPEYDEIDMETAIPETLPAEAEVVVEEEAPEVEATPVEPRDVPAVEVEEIPDETDAGMSAEYEVELLSAMAVEVAVAEPAVAEDSVYVEPTTFYTARKCDMSGNVLMEIDLSEAVSEVEWFYCQTMAETAEGDLVIFSGETLHCFGPDGQRKDDITAGGDFYVSSMVSTETGTVVVSGWDNMTGSSVVCTIENGTMSAPLEVTGTDNMNSLNLFPGSGSTVLGSDGDILYSVDVTTGAATKLLSWLDSDINGSYISGVLADGSEKVLVLIEDWMNSDGVRYELGTLTKTPVEEIPERTLLSIGGEYLDLQVKNAIIDFNRTNDTYRLVFKDYSVYNTEEDYTLGQKQLDMDVISGVGPDLISLGGTNVEKYMSKGALADLSAMMEEDGDISMDDLLSGPMQGYIEDGKLYAMPYYFHVNTLYGSRELLGDRESWTMAEMTDVLMGLEDGVRAFQYSTRSAFLSDMIYYNLGLFVDYSKAACTFDSDIFKSLLEASAKLPEEYDPFDENGEYVYVDEMQQVMNGDVLLSTGYVSGSYDLEYMFNLYTPENGFVRIGYPTESGSGVLIHASSGVAVAASCQHKDGAWDFIETLLDEDFQGTLWNLPVLESAFDAMMAEEMEPEYYEDENGEKVYFENYGWIGGTQILIEQLTEAQVEEFKAELNAGTPASGYDNEIMQIITEESEAFFTGDKTADEVAELIQNRVSIYLGEIG